jgi:tetratricopeptide (TPR) repeat protein
MVSNGQPVRQPAGREGEGSDAGSPKAPQQDAVESYAGETARQFEQALEPVLAKLPQRIAEALQARSVDEVDRQGAQFVLQHSHESHEAPPNAGSASPEREGTRAGGKRMATETTQTEERQTQGALEGNGSTQSTDERHQSKRRTRDQGEHGYQPQAPSRDRDSRSHHPVHDPQAATRAAFLRLAWNWKEAGATYQAIHAYTEILARFPGTGLAAAAAEDLLDIAQTLEQQGRFHSALDIFNQLDRIS